MAEPAAPTAAAPDASGRRRLVAVLAVVAALVAAGLADRVERAPAPGSAAIAVGMPAAASGGALSSTWFCPGATSSGSGSAEGYVAVANPTAGEVAGTVTIRPSEGVARSVPLTIAPYSTAQLRYSDLAVAPWSAVTVEMGAGEVAVEQVVTGPLGWSAAACASEASGEWYVAGGSTARDNEMYLTLYNPFPDDAIVDLSFATSEGAASPQAFRGVVLRAGAVTVLSVGEQVRRRDDVAVSVVARRGRLVAGKVQIRAAAPTGLSWSLAAPSTATSFTFPEGFVADGVGERLNLYNPGDREAVVDVELVLDEGVAEPWEIRVPPGDRAILDLGGEERVPRGVPHALLVRSLNGRPFVAEQWLTSAAPAARAGSVDVVGSRRSATAWVFAAGAATPDWDEWISVQNVSARDAVVDIVALAAGQKLAIEGLQSLAVPAGTRRSFRLGDHISRPELGLLVSGDQPLVVERSQFATSGRGFSYAVGVPLGLRER